jgi:hypothetical protein
MEWSAGPTFVPAFTAASNSAVEATGFTTDAMAGVITRCSLDRSGRPSRELGYLIYTHTLGKVQ